MTRTVKANLVVADGIAPVVTAPSTSLVTGTLGTASVPVRVAWSATDPSGIVGLGIQRSVNGGTWLGMRLASAAVRAVVQSLPINSGVTQRIRATDGKANTSAFATGPIVRNAVSQQAMRGIAYAGIWHSLASSTASGGSVRYSTARRASVTFRFSGASIAWVSSRGRGRGSAYVYVDGVYIKTVNLYSTVGQSRAIVFTRNWGTVGIHTITIVVAGTAGHPRVDVDAFVRLGLG
jgi:hypothetical protein